MRKSDLRCQANDIAVSTVFTSFDVIICFESLEEISLVDMAHVQLLRPSCAHFELRCPKPGASSVFMQGCSAIISSTFSLGKVRCTVLFFITRGAVRPTVTVQRVLHLRRMRFTGVVSVTSSDPISRTLRKSFQFTVRLQMRYF